MCKRCIDAGFMPESWGTQPLTTRKSKEFHRPSSSSQTRSVSSDNILFISTFELFVCHCINITHNFVQVIPEDVLLRCLCGQKYRVSRFHLVSLLTMANLIEQTVIYTLGNSKFVCFLVIKRDQLKSSLFG